MRNVDKEAATTIESHLGLGSAACPVVAAGRIRILLVEPRRIYADMLAHSMRAGDFAVTVACSETAALTALRVVDPDVVVVCVGPTDQGAAVLDRVREAAQGGVVALTDAEMAPLVTRVAVVAIGDSEMLSTRIRRSLRKIGVCGAAGDAQRRQIDDLVVDVAARRVYQRGNAVPLTRTEFAILRALSDNPGEPVTCRRLQESLWGASHPGGRAALGVHVGNLRRKLGDDPTCPRYVRTVRGIGYCLVD
ncbi:response regulator receiver protein [Mycobacterium sp. BK558]|jgi:DNA-binding response OmpR family regulator|uniref:winged helix-turn-helix transcriptional regulator n=1 Tax=Mycolicibacterium sp. D5.8-2 TaxID=3085903 RepID=UPI0010E8CFD8|nr:response regulator transcription factor [Mycolicibacterium sp. D5.8-2]MDW5613902.1 response regulator transcription factor [Mycolicibacterium sp. D5.8-2]RZT11550.1 response regulator receiver protein [Mycobacterium sp. BK558]